MRIIEPYIRCENTLNGHQILLQIERIGRVCYKSEDRITNESALQFVKNILDRGHESVIEHISLSVRVICDRGVSHEIVRHRIASYSQESTRYCNYAKDKFGNELVFIKPLFFDEKSDLFIKWKHAMEIAEETYLYLIAAGSSPQEARTVLPNSLKTEIIMTMNLREWRHFLRLRTSSVAHPQMRQIAQMILDEFKSNIPILFDDIGD